jgi:formylglycine-generating enzyme required for sulfatase activity
MYTRNSQPSTADIRQFLTEFFSDEELATLCFDYFRDVYDDFAAGMTKGQKIQLVLERCERRGVLPNLLAAIQRARPDQYKEGFPQVEIQPEQPRMERDPRQVFISHAHQDANFAHRLTKDLQKHGWRVWIAPDSIRLGEKWGEAIDRGLGESGIFVAVLSPASVQSRWVRNETYVAIELESKGYIRFVPLDVERCDVPGLWNVYQRVSFLGNYADGLKALLVDLGQTGRPPSTKLSALPEPSQTVGAAGEKSALRKAALAPKLAAIFAHLLRQRSLVIGAGTVALVALMALIAVIVANKGLIPLALTRPRVSAKDGMVMVYVPAGEFLMGSTNTEIDTILAGCKDCKRDWYIGELPQHKVDLDAFWIDKTEVTNGQYNRCVQAGACKASGFADNSVYNGDTQPAAGVDWSDAQAYCEWAGRTLPTEAQWEKAARGTDSRIYPWGNQAATCDYAVMNEGKGSGCGKGDAAWPVGSKPKSASPYSALDMAGNVWEWVADWYDDTYYASSPPKNPPGPSFGQYRVLRGGSFDSKAYLMRGASRNWDDPGLWPSNRGFRCACASGSSSGC